MIEHLTRPVAGASTETRVLFSRALWAALDKVGVHPGEAFVVAPENGKPLAVDENTDGLFREDGSTTSKKAALEIYPKSGSARWRVFCSLADAGEFGRTRDELATRLHVSPDTIRPRVVELIDGGWIMVAEGRTRKTPSGRDSEILVLTSKGWQEHLSRERRYRTQPPLPKES